MKRKVASMSVCSAITVAAVGESNRRLTEAKAQKAALKTYVKQELDTNESVLLRGAPCGTQFSIDSARV